MNRKFRIFLIAFVLLLAFLVFTNPEEDKYLNVISEDYGKMHHGMDMSPKSLLTIGSGLYDNYLVFSIYRYAFGRIEVTYFGIGGSVYHLGYQNAKSKGQDEIEEFALIGMATVL